MSEGSLADRVRAGDRRALARALTVVEAGGPEAEALLAALAPAARAARRVGVTGPPGAGKSTLAAALAGHWRARGRRVGVLAVDPTSPFTGGAILGDRIRMAAVADDEGVFIRSLASRGAPGGLSETTEDAADVLAAAAFDPVLIETVGAGQGEIAVAGAADVVLVVLAPGAGDDIQAMKAGLLEIADVLVVNQSDRPEAQDLARALEGALDMRTGGRRPALLSTSATRGEGVAALAAEIERRWDGEAVESRRAGRALARIRARVDALHARRYWEGREAVLRDQAAAVAAGRRTVAEAVEAVRGAVSPPEEAR